MPLTETEETIMIVAKFGGTSLADADAIRNAVNILRDNPERKYMVVSAPGKRFGEDIKVTDLLYQVYEAAENGRDYMPALRLVQERFEQIAADLDIELDLDREFEMIIARIEEKPSRDYLASRGEYLNAKVISAYLGWPMIDAANTIFFDSRRRFDEAATYPVLRRAMRRAEHAVIPGFYGGIGRDEICTFSRGGSDVTGAIAARAVKADVYENWTDVNGLLTADPRVIPEAKTMEWISYRELRELSYMGASVMHEDTVLPVRTAGIPIHICNSSDPSAHGTWIVSGMPDHVKKRGISGIAGKTGFSNLQIEKVMMNVEIGFGASVLRIIAEHGVSFEHMPTSMETMSVLVSTPQLDHCRDEILKEIDDELHPDRIFIEDGIALIAVVGEGISNTGAAARILQVIADADISIRMVDASFGELIVIVAVPETDYQRTVRALYDGLKKDM